MTKNLVEDKKEIDTFFNYFFEVFAGGTEGRGGPRVAVCPLLTYMLVLSL